MAKTQTTQTTQTNPNPPVPPAEQMGPTCSGAAGPPRSGEADPTALAIEQMRADAERRERIARAKAILEPLTKIRTPGPEYGGEYRLNRAGQKVTVTAAQLERARKAHADPLATLPECLAALRTMAKLPYDYVVQDKDAPLYSFPDGTGRSVSISSAMILAAREMANADE